VANARSSDSYWAFKSPSSVGMLTSTLPPGFVVAEGSFSGLSSPLVPHVMSCVLQKAYTFRMLMYVGVRRRYCMN
jgi:hypothetical protein